MLKKNQKKSLLSLTVIILLVLIGSGPAFGDKSEQLKPLLVDLSGWTAGEPGGMSMDMGGMKITNATRSYESGGKTISSMIIIGTNAMVQSQKETGNVGNASSGGMTMKSEVIDGFQVVRAFDENEGAGSIIVSLVSGQVEGGIFLLSFNGISSNDALEIAKKYDWGAMKAKTSAIIK